MGSGEVHRVVAGGLTFAYRAAGQPDNPPLVLLHGMGEGAASWEPVLADLAGLGYRVIALDARGHEIPVGHMVHVQSPGEFVAAVRMFLIDLDPLWPVAAQDRSA